MLLFFIASLLNFSACLSLLRWPPALATLSFLTHVPIFSLSTYYSADSRQPHAPLLILSLLVSAYTHPPVAGHLHPSGSQGNSTRSFSHVSVLHILAPSPAVLYLFFLLSGLSYLYLQRHLCISIISVHPLIMIIYSRIPGPQPGVSPGVNPSLTPKCTASTAELVIPTTNICPSTVPEVMLW